VETFSPSARQFLDRIERPAVDRITGLPPAIAVRQQMRADGPRNTLGTRTEILDSLRLLFARLARSFCPDCQIPVEPTSPESAAAEVIERAAGARVIVATQPDWTDETADELIARLIRIGYTRAILNGTSIRIEDIQQTADLTGLLVVTDRSKAESANGQRLAESIANAMKLGHGSCVVLSELPTKSGAVPETMTSIDSADWYALRFSSRRECASCGKTLPEPSAEILSFTSPLGACPQCEGTGTISVTDSGKKRGPRTVTPDSVCPLCHGSRLNSIAMSMRWADRTLPQVETFEISELIEWLDEQSTQLSESLQHALRPAFEHAQKRLRFLDDCGLGYLSIGRSMRSLSGGEAQRAMLTSALGSGLINTLYVLDEPTAGLHFSDTAKVIASVRRLQELGNTVIVVEHDPTFILSADEVIEIGPGAGDDGGTVVFQGTPAELLQENSLTAVKLRQSQQQTLPKGDVEPETVPKGRKKGVRKKAAESVSQLVAEGVASMRKRRVPERWLKLKNVTSNNLHGINVELPLEVFCAVTGVSGSGKSSLIADALYPALCRKLNLPCAHPTSATIGNIDGASEIENVLLLDQSPIPRSRRSIPATWIGVFDDIRILLAETHEAKKRNYSRAIFSFNASSGGRCPVCEGRGVVTVAMQFLADIQTTCEECHGRRFRPDVLEIRYRDRSVHDILNMTADEAFTFFNGHHRIQQRLNAVRQTGLGYLRLGQPLSTISGGEAQRMRIAGMLAGVPLTDGDTAAENRKASTLTRSGRTLFLLDEPSSGLHLQDIDRLLNCIDFLLQTGHSIIVIDHDEFLTSQADWQIELGPGAGKNGGRIIRSEPTDGLRC
jgi:excinuclease ABC subunit A